MNLRQITQNDQLKLKEVYFDSINSIDGKIYNRNQKFAWSSQAWENPNFNESLLKGKGWKLSEGNKIIGFATRFPDNKLSLFYVRGNLCRKGFGTTILDSIEKEASSSGVKTLETEASLISYQLLLKRGWEIIRKEKIKINNFVFERYKMFKIL